MIVIAERNFPGYELWRDALESGADLLFRAGSSFELPIDQVLEDGSYLSRLKTPRDLRRSGAQDIVVRVIKYQLIDDFGGVTETFTLISTLFDPNKAPAVELAELYHGRWSIETAFGAFKSKLKGNGVVLRSKNPDGAEQELWALLCTYYAIRDLIYCAACLTEQVPSRISFVGALDAVRSPIGDPGSFSPHRLIDDLIPAWLLYVVASAANPDRSGRSNPRHAKRSQRYPAKSANRSKRLEPRKPLSLFILCASSQGFP